MLATLEEARTLIAQKEPLILAGDENLLGGLPAGNWIGGTIPYFMTDRGGQTTRDQIFVERIPGLRRGYRIATYDPSSIAGIGQDSPDNGYTILILPAFTALHQQYALEAPRYPDLFLKVVAGWISGVHVDELGRRAPKVFDGTRGEVIADRAVAIHVELPASHRAQVGIVNIFEPGDGDEIRFLDSGFEVHDCLINGERRSFQEYFSSRKLDARLPLVANFCGTMVNVSIRSLDAAGGMSSFYAPVFADVPYRLARPVPDYAERFSAAIPAQMANPAFACNCVLNFLYGELEGRQTGKLRGPMTFGEIAYQLLNQTLVHVTISSTG